MKIKIKKVGPPAAGRHSQIGYVKLGGEYFCEHTEALDICAAGEFEPATDADRAAFERLRAEREAAASEAKDKAQREADSAAADAKAEGDRAEQAAREESERAESARLAELNAAVGQPATFEAPKAKKAK